MGFENCSGFLQEDFQMIPPSLLQTADVNKLLLHFH